MIFAKSFEEWVKLGDRAYAQASYGDALRCYEKALEQDQNQPQGWYRLGLALLGTADHPVAALRALLRARQLFRERGGPSEESASVQRAIDDTDWSAVVNRYRVQPPASQLGTTIGQLLAADPWGVGPGLETAFLQFTPSVTGQLTYGGKIMSARWENAQDPRDGKWSFEAHIVASLSQYLWRSCRAGLFFRFEGDRNFISTRDARLAAPDGSLTIQEELISPFQYSTWNDITLRLPLTTLYAHLAPGEWRLEAMIYLLAPDRSTKLDATILPFHYKVG